MGRWRGGITWVHVGRTLLWYEVKTGLWNLVRSFFTNENVKGTSPIRWGVKTGCWIKTYFVSWVVVQVFWGVFWPPPQPTRISSSKHTCCSVSSPQSCSLFPYSLRSCPSNPLWSAKRQSLLLAFFLLSALCSRHYPCLSMFNCSEKLPSWLSACLKKKKKKKCDGLSVGIWLGPSV